jgi:hypothetical protein
VIRAASLLDGLTAITHWGGQNSNPRPTDYEAGLPDSPGWFPFDVVPQGSRTARHSRRNRTVPIDFGSLPSNKRRPGGREDSRPGKSRAPVKSSRAAQPMGGVQAGKVGAHDDRINFFVSRTESVLCYDASHIGSDTGPHTCWDTCLRRPPLPYSVAARLARNSRTSPRTPRR